MHLAHVPTVQLLTCATATLGVWWGTISFKAPYWRLYWNARPGAEVGFGSVRTALLPRRFVLIPPETPFTGRCLKAAPHLYLHFLVQAPYDRMQPAIHVIPATGLLLRLARQLSDNTRYPDQQPGEEVRQRSALSAMALIHVALSQLPPGSFKPAPTDPRITRALRAMESAPAASAGLSNDALASLAGMSTNAFIRLFRGVTGQTPQALYLSQRIGRSCMHLHFTDKPIDEIAREAGFCDRYHFSRTFKRLRGLGPAQFRRQAQGLRRA